MALVLYKNLGQYLSTENASVRLGSEAAYPNYSLIVNSPVITAAINKDSNKVYLSEPVVFTVKHIQVLYMLAFFFFFFQFFCHSNGVYDVHLLIPAVGRELQSKLLFLELFQTHHDRILVHSGLQTTGHQPHSHLLFLHTPHKLCSANGPRGGQGMSHTYVISTNLINEVANVNICCILTEDSMICSMVMNEN